MKTIEIKGQIRKETGKKATKKLRKQKEVPCVLYGGEKNVHFSAHKNMFNNLIYTPSTYIVKLDVNGTKYDAVMKDAQFHPVTDEIIHIDFLQIFEDKKVVVNIPVQLHGFAEGVQAGGKLHILKRKIKVKAFHKDLPDQFDIDIENLELGKSIKIAELFF